MLGRGFLPQGEVGGVVFLVLSVQCAGCGQEFVDVASAEASVAAFGVEFGYVEVNRAFADVSEAAVENFFDVFDLLDNVTRCVRFY
jgi:hypothetical protein